MPSESSDSTPCATLEQGLIGNCRISALVDERARVSWCCFPRLDGDPVFSALVDGDAPGSGFFDIEMLGLASARQYYVRNTAILRTELEDEVGNRLRITDFAPRFTQYERRFRPVMIIRHAEVLHGSPTIRVRLRPHSAYGEEAYRITQGSNHLRYVGSDHVVRLTTDASIAHVLQEHPFVLETSATLVLGPDESIQEAPGALGQRFESRTRAYWQDWCRTLAVPFDWQRPVIRSAITLKLSTFDDTGAIVAAMTSSIPEIAGRERNWDYRYCWLRDAYFVVHALNRLGATGTLESYLRYIINLVAAAGDDHATLQPLYGIGGEREVVEREADALAGYRGNGPVRVGNDAYRQVQHDVYGAVVLAATHAFFDQRLERPGDEMLFRRLVPIAEHAARLYDQPDAGIWEFRGRSAVHTYSAVMCWAACDRMARIARHLGLAEEAGAWADRAATMHERICAAAWNPRRNSFAATFGEDDSVDASLLLLHELDFLAADDPRFAGTVAAIEADLRSGDHLFRYARHDDFGPPENAFNICTFWFIDALDALGRRDEARRLFENMLGHTTRLGLLSEDLDPRTGELWGNFPQTYSMVGLINSALRLSRPWEEAI